MLNNTKFIVICLLVFTWSYCSTPVQKPIEIGGKVILYSEEKNSSQKLVELNPDTNEKYYFQNLGTTEQKKYLLFDKGKKILIFPQLGVYGRFHIYDIETGQEELKQIDLPGEKDDIIRTYSATDSLLVFANGNNIFIKQWNNFAELSKINLHAIDILKVSCNKNNILAVGYNAASSNLGVSNTIVSIDPSDFTLVDLKNKTEIKLPIQPEWIGSWSSDGKYLLTADSASVNLLEYPSLSIHRLKGFTQDTMKVYNMFFLDNNEIVFNGVTNNNPHVQIYLYDILKQKIVRKISNGDADEELLDVYSQ